MNELDKLANELPELQRLVINLDSFIDRLPPGLVSTCLFVLLDDIKYLAGYIDCMINFKIEPLPDKIEKSS